LNFPENPAVAIVASLKDKAGMLISSILKSEFGFRPTEKTFDSNPVFSNAKMELYFTREKQIFADYVNEIPADFLVFASRHSSKAGTPSLTVHTIGNWSEAQLGGKSRQLVSTSAFLQRNYLLALAERKRVLGLAHEVTMEVTHHGPWLEKPCIFIEVGSDEEQWGNETACRAVAGAIANCTSFESTAVPCIGFGGTHYATEFTKVAQRLNYAFSFMVPKHALEFLDEGMVRQMVERTIEKPTLAVLDWKGLGRQKEKVLGLLDSIGLKRVRSRQLLSPNSGPEKEAGNQSKES